MSNTKTISEGSPFGKFYLSNPHVQSSSWSSPNNVARWVTAMWSCRLSSTLPASGGHTPTAPAWVAAKPRQFSHSLITGGPAGWQYSELPVTWWPSDAEPWERPPVWPLIQSIEQKWHLWCFSNNKWSNLRGPVSKLVNCKVLKGRGQG